MSVRMRHTSSHTKNRRSHHALTSRKPVADKATGNKRMSHRIDEKTGMYRGKLIKAPKEKKDNAPIDKAEGPAEGKAKLPKETMSSKVQSKGIEGAAPKERSKARSGTGS